MKNTLLLALFVFLAALLDAQTPRLMPPLSHSDEVTTLACSPNGQFILSGSGDFDNTVLLWDTSGNLLKVMSGHKLAITRLAFSPPDGKLMLSLDKAGVLLLWNFSQEKPQLTLKESLLAADFSADGKSIVGLTFDMALKIFDLKGNVIRQLAEYPLQPDEELQLSHKLSLKCSPDGKWVATTYASPANIIRIHNLRDGALIHELDHGDVVLAIAISPDGSTLVSGGADKTARLWNMESGEALKEMGPHEQVVGSVAFSPLGDLIATGETQAPGNVYLWDANGNPFDKFNGDYSWVNDMVFAPDDRTLLIACDERSVIHCDLEGGYLAQYENSSSAVTSVGFSSEDLILTGGEGRNVRLWELTGGEAFGLDSESELNTPVAFHPDGLTLLVGESGESLLQWNLLEDQRNVIPKRRPASVGALAYSPDGNYFVTSNFSGGVQLWENGNGRLIWEEQLPSNMAIALAFSPDGNDLLVAATPSILNHLEESGQAAPESQDIGPIGRYSVRDFSPKGSYGEAASAFALSPDGKYIAVNDNFNLVIYSYANGSEVARVDFPESSFQFVYSLAFDPQGSTVAAGFLNGAIKQYDLDGKLVREYKGHSGPVRTMTFSPDGRFLLSGGSDNMTKLWDAATGGEIVTLIAIGTEDWVVLTPDGMFDASPGAMDQLYFVVETEIVELEQLKSRYWDPHLLAKVLGYSDDARLQAPALTKMSLPPDIEARIENNQLIVKLTANGNGSLGDLSIFINGKQRLADANPGKKNTLTIDLKQFNEWYTPDTNIITLQALCYGWLNSQPYQLTYLPPASGKGQGGNANPNDPTSLGDGEASLYGIVIGTSQYPSTELRLTFPDVDAERFYTALQVAGKGLFNERVHLKLLTSTGTAPATLATKANIQAAFAEFEKKALPQDVFIIFFSGHGKTLGTGDKSKFYYLTKDISAWSDLDKPDLLGKGTISSDEIIGWLKNNKAAKQALILDACNSAAVGQQFGAAGKGMSSAQIRVADDMKNLTGTYILAGAAADRESFEAPRFGQGLLTYSLLDGMRGEVRGKDNRLDIMRLLNYACSTVPKLATTVGKKQEPEMFLPKNAKGGFFIGIVTSPEQIVLPKAMPVIVRNNLFDPQTGNDDLGLTKVLKETLWEKMSGKMVFYDIDEYPDAFRINGPYRVEGDVVKVTVSVFQNKKLVKKIDQEVVGSTADLPALANAILKAAGPFMKN